MERKEIKEKKPLDRKQSMQDRQLDKVKDEKIQDYKYEVENGTVSSVDRHKGLSFMDKWRLKTSPDSTFWVEMFYSNGTSREFIIKTKDEFFKRKKRRYYLRFQDVVFNITHREYKLYFHEDYFCPISPKEIVQEEDPEPAEEHQRRAWWSVKPHNAKEVFDMEYIKVLASAVELSKWLKFIILLVVVDLLLDLMSAYLNYRGVG